MNIVTYPNTILETVCVEIENLENYKEVLLKMQSFVNDPLNKAAGLAMPQIGITKRAFVADIQGQTEIFINPRIIKRSNNMISLTNGEGCLSIPEFKGVVPRHKKIDVVYTNIEGVRISKTLSDIDSIVFQHEFDHLNGELFISKMKKQEKAAV